MPQRIQKLALNLLLIGIMVTFSLTGCASQSANPISGGDTLVQISTIDAVLNGLYDGVTDFKTLKSYGDFGIGTFQALDGEMIAVRHRDLPGFRRRNDRRGRQVLPG